MALNGLLDIELSVPNPTDLLEFWERHGMVRTADGGARSAASSVTSNPATTVTRT